MEQEKKKIDNKALIGTVIFHVAVLVAFIFFGLSTPLPLPEEEGVMVNFGFSDQGMGQRQPLVSSPPPPQPQPTQTPQASEDIATQDTDPSVAIPTSPSNQTRPVTNTRPDQQPPQPETTQPTPEPEPEPQPVVNPNALFPGRDQQTTANQNQGQTGQPGNQGSPQGTPDGTATNGGGQGNGIEFSLSGRRANHLPLPEYTTQSQGRVVVAITVNRNGQVVRARAGERGTTTSDRVLWAAAEAAAMRARFDVKNDAPHEQTGTITYNFIRLN